MSGWWVFMSSLTKKKTYNIILILLKFSFAGYCFKFFKKFIKSH